jgi:hypothetical protein
VGIARHFCRFSPFRRAVPTLPFQQMMQRRFHHEGHEEHEEL